MYCTVYTVQCTVYYYNLHSIIIISIICGLCIRSSTNTNITPAQCHHNATTVLSRPYQIGHHKAITAPICLLNGHFETQCLQNPCSQCDTLDSVIPNFSNKTFLAIFNLSLDVFLEFVINKIECNMSKVCVIGGDPLN